MHDLKTWQKHNTTHYLCCGGLCKNMGPISSRDEIGTDFCIDNESYYFISKSLNMYNSIYYGYTVTGYNLSCNSLDKKSNLPQICLVQYVANMKFAKLCNQCKGRDGRICTKTSKFGHHHVCTWCKDLQSS